MIKEKELTNNITATLDDATKSYRTPSGAFLEIIRNFASEQRIEDIADEIKIYVEMYSQTGKFIAASLPAILSNCYFTVLEDFPFGNFIEWSVQDKEWGNRIKESYNNKEALAQSVLEITQDVINYKKDMQ